MSANEEFPRGGFAFISLGGVGTASIVLPASPGIAHVVDEFFGKLINLSAAAAMSTNITLIGSTLGTISNIGVATSSTVGTADTDTQTPNLAFTVGEQVTLQAVSAAGFAVYLTLKWHDI